MFKLVTLKSYKDITGLYRDITWTTQECYRVVTYVLYWCYRDATRRLKGFIVSIYEGTFCHVKVGPKPFFTKTCIVFVFDLFDKFHKKTLSLGLFGGL